MGNAPIYPRLYCCPVYSRSAPVLANSTPDRNSEKLTLPVVEKSALRLSAKTKCQNDSCAGQQVQKRSRKTACAPPSKCKIEVFYAYVEKPDPNPPSTPIIAIWPQHCQAIFSARYTSSCQNFLVDILGQKRYYVL